MSRSARAPASDSWYLDPVVARQKAEVFLSLVERWRDRDAVGPTLKTDLFEEANGDDALVPQLERGQRVFALDLDPRTVCRARQRFPAANARLLAADLRNLGVRDGAFDLVVSPSTLDHFATRQEMEVSLREIHRVLRPRGTAVVILDNPLNPLYHPLRWLAPLVAPFGLGRTAGRRALRRTLESLGFEILGDDYVIHNPRGILTVINLLLRFAVGGRAERPIAAMVRMFAALDRLPTRRFSACFVALGARKRASAPPADGLHPAGDAPDPARAPAR